MGDPPRRRGAAPSGRFDARASATLSFALAVVAALCFIVLHPRRAAACEPPSCLPSAIVPAGGRIPANAPGIHWQPGWPGPHPIPLATVDAHAVLAEDLEATGLETEGILEAPELQFLPFGGPLEEGRSLVVTFADPCAGGGRSAKERVEVAIGPAAPLPETLGTLKVAARDAGPLTVASAGGGCSESILASSVVVELEPSEAMRPWADLALYRTFVDDRPWHAHEVIGRAPPPGESWVGRGRDRLYVDCERPEGSPLAPGTHRLRLEAQLPGLEDPLATPPLEVELECGSDLMSEVRAEERSRATRSFFRRMGRAVLREPILFALGLVVVVGGVAFFVFRRRRPKGPFDS